MVGDAPFTKISTNTQDMKGKFPLWCLKKLLNSEEHCMVKQDGVKYDWCEDGHSFENKSCGMYCMHKPDDGHIAWLAQREKFKKDDAMKKGNATPALSVTLPSPVPSNTTKSNICGSSKLSLLKSFQSVLMTKAGISEDQFKKIWNDACASKGY